MRRIDRVRVHRVKDASGRRLPLQAKVGATLEPDEFRERVRAGRLGHVGLLESAHALATAFGWRLTRVEQAIDPVIAATVVSSGLGDIAPGRVLGLHQTLNAWSDEEQVIELKLKMVVGLPDQRDHVQLAGDPPLEAVVPGGLHCDAATAALVVNAIPRALDGPRGMITMAEIAPPRPF